MSPFLASFIISYGNHNFRTPLHEAIRGGSLEAVMFLVNFGLDINHRTNGGTGGSPLWLAKKILGESHDNPNDVVLYLKIHGAKDIPPDD